LSGQSRGRGERVARDRPPRPLFPRAQGTDPARGRQAGRGHSGTARIGSAIGRGPDDLRDARPCIGRHRGPEEFHRGQADPEGRGEQGQPGPVRLVPARHHLRSRRRPRSRGACDRRAQQPREPAEDGAGHRANRHEGHPARNSGLSSRAGHCHGVARRARQEGQEIQGPEEAQRANGTEGGKPPAKPGLFGAALPGGIAGSLLTAFLLFAALPGVLRSKIVRDGMLAAPRFLLDASEALRDAQYAPVLAANRAALETPFGSSWKGSAKPEVTLIEFFDYACPYCKASNPAIDRLIQEDKGLRVVYRELPILGPDSVSAARLSLEASKLGRLAQFHDTLWAAGRPSPETNTQAAAAAGIAPQPTADPAIEAELNSNMRLAGALRAPGTPVFVIGDRVMNGAVGYGMLKDAIAKARAKA